MMRPIHFVFDIEVRKLFEMIQCNAILNFNYDTPFQYFVKLRRGDRRDMLHLLGGSCRPWLLFSVLPS